MHKHVSRIALASAALALGMQGALALDANDFSAKFANVSDFFGFGLTIASASAEGDSVTLSGFTLSVPGEEPIEIDGAVVFEGVSETGDGGYTANRATTEDILIEDEETDLTFSFANILAEDIWIPAQIDNSNSLLASYRLVGRAEAGPLVVSSEGSEVFSLDQIEIWYETDDAVTDLTSGFSVTGIRADLSTIPDPEAQAVITAFELEDFQAEINALGSWQPGENGRVVLDELDFRFPGLGTLGITGSFVGYTYDLYNEMIKSQAKLADLGAEATPAQIAALEQELTGQMLALEIEALRIRYDDDSLFDKAIAFTAAEQGTDAATMKTGMKFMAGMALTGLENPTLTAMLTEAINAFVDNPQSLSVIMEPEEPVALSVFESAEEDPFALVDLLNLQVVANQ